MKNSAVATGLEKVFSSQSQTKAMPKNVQSESEVAQSCPTLRDPMEGSRPGSSAHEIFQVRVLEWVAVAFSSLENFEHYSASM